MNNSVFDFFYVDLIRLPILFHTQVFLSCLSAPGWHVFLYADVCGDNFENLTELHFLDLFGRLDDRHRTEQAITIQCFIGMHGLLLQELNPDLCCAAMRTLCRLFTENFAALITPIEFHMTA
jgi:hypothetical protein